MPAGLTQIALMQDTRRKVAQDKVRSGDQRAAEAEQTESASIAPAVQGLSRADKRRMQKEVRQQEAERQAKREKRHYIMRCAFPPSCQEHLLHPRSLADVSKPGSLHMLLADLAACMNRIRGVKYAH